MHHHFTHIMALSWGMSLLHGALSQLAAGILIHWQDLFLTLLATLPALVSFYPNKLLE